MPIAMLYLKTGDMSRFYTLVVLRRSGTYQGSEPSGGAEPLRICIRQQLWSFSELVTWRPSSDPTTASVSGTTHKSSHRIFPGTDRNGIPRAYRNEETSFWPQET